MVNAMKYLSESTIRNKRVILRCDFNVPVSDGIIKDDSKIIRSLRTIRYLLENNNKVIILSHFGRVKKEEDKLHNSLYPVYKELKKYIDLDFIENPLNLDEINNSDKYCFLVENTRWTDLPEKRESNNELELARYWSTFGNIFVLDAFGSMHRIHASTAGLSKYLPTYLGFLVEEELKNLNILIDNPEHPFVVIMGGAKVDDKIQIIERIIKKCDKLILTGGILNTFLKVSGKEIGASLVSENEDVLQSVKNILNTYSEKIFFTDKFSIKRNNLVKEVVVNEVLKDDIIYDNITNLKSVLEDAKIIFLNGTCGKYEEEDYYKGTYNLLNDLNDINAKIIVGGGDTVSAVIKFAFKKNIYYLSSGGGATLEYVAYGELRSLKWILENGVDN